MDKIKQLLARITELDDTQLEELRGLILDASDAFSSDPRRVHGVESAEQLESLAAAATTIRQEVRRREQNVLAAHEATRVLASFRTEPLRASARVPDDRLPAVGRVTQGRAHALTASGMELHNSDDFSQEFLTQLRAYQGTRGTHGDKLLVASLKTERGPNRTLRTTDSAEAVTAAFATAAEEHVLGTVNALTAAGGRGPFTDTDYTLVGFESTARPVKTALPTFTSRVAAFALSGRPDSVTSPAAWASGRRRTTSTR